MSAATRILLLGIAVLCLVDGQLQNNKAPDDLNTFTRDHDVLRPNKIRGPGGRAVKLRCAGDARGTQPRPRLHGVLWQYMPCGNAHGMTPCKNYVDEKDLSNWTTLTGESFNRTTATIQRATEKENGLYRCSIKNKSHPRILTTYELDIVDKAESQPEIIQGPENQTVIAGARASFQCLVLSKIEPTVRWFRKQDLSNIEPTFRGFTRYDQPGSRNKTQSLQYFNDTYEPMESHTVKRPQDVYLSKLILMATTEWDSGFYVCLAVNNIDFVFRGAHLTVFSTSPQSEEEETSPLSLSWLFLIPVALAIIPLTVWLCCLCRRSHRSTKTSTDQVDQLQQINPRYKYVQTSSEQQPNQRQQAG